MNVWTLCFFTGAMTALGLIPMPGFLERRDVVDRENHRTSHIGTIPRGAGVVLYGAFFVAVVLGLISSLWDDPVLVISATFLIGSLMFIGLADDIVGVPIALRLGSQIAMGGMLGVLASPTSVRLSFGFALLILVGVGVGTIINVVNFMDGINGISGITALLVSGTYASLAWEASIDDVALLSICIAATALGFLPHNVPRARLFLGDSGSYYLGASLGVLNVLLWIKGFSTIVVLAPLSLYLADVGFTLVRRTLRGEVPWEPHREHRYQKLASGGLGHAKTATYVGLLTLCLCGASWLDRTGYRMASLGLIVVVLITYFRLPVISEPDESGAVTA